MSQEWDIALGRNSASLVAVLPRAIGVVLIERGQFRAKLRVTPEGLLVTPYTSPERTRNEPAAELPQWSS